MLSADTREGWIMDKRIIVGAAVVLAIVAVPLVMNLAREAGIVESPDTTPSGPPPADAGSGVVTLALFNYVQEGMTHDEVAALIGKNGRLTEEMRLPDLHGGESEIIVYVWENPDGSHFEGRFKNGKLITKLHQNLE
jgi:hypothetical protein